MAKEQNGVAMLLAPLDPVPAAVSMVEQLDRFEKLDPKIQEARSLAEEHFSHVDMSALEEHVGPLLWTWFRGTCIPPLMPLPPTDWPNGRPWPFWPPRQWPPPYFNWWIGPVLIGNGTAVLQGTEMLLAGPLSQDSIAALGNEVARWSRSTPRNTDRLGAMQDEFGSFVDGFSKGEVERKAPVVAGVVAGAVFLGAAYLAYMSM